MATDTNLNQKARELAKRVLEIESTAIHDLMDSLDDSFDLAVEAILGRRGRIIVSGMGKSGLIGQKLAATFSSTGTPAYFMHPAEALHGDLGMIVEGDLVIALSNSGETEELVRLVALIRRLGATIWTITGNPNSSLAQHADGHLYAGVNREACPLDLVPTASTTAALAMGDALAVACYAKRGFNADSFSRFHPGGRLGRKLRLVREGMHADAFPSVKETAPVRDALKAIADYGLGMTCVVDSQNEKQLTGIVTDGDLRRALLSGAFDLNSPVKSLMTSNPKTIAVDALQAEALAMLEKNKITALPVLDQDELVGVIQIHDLWRTELF